MDDAIRRDSGCLAILIWQIKHTAMLGMQRKAQSHTTKCTRIFAKRYRDDEITHEEY